MKLATVPVFGILPYGGLVTFSLLGLVGCVFLFSLERKRKLEKELEWIQKEKLPSWSFPLAIHTVEKKIAHYESQIERLREVNKHYSEELEKGRTAELQLQLSDGPSKLQACQAAIKELKLLAQNTETSLIQYIKKCRQWINLKNNLFHIAPEKLEEFRKAKENKWQTKLSKLNYEKKMNMLSIAGNVASLSRLFLALGGVVAGYGILNFPQLVNTGLEVVVSGGGIANFFLKRTIQKIEVPSIELTPYIVAHENI